MLIGQLQHLLLHLRQLFVQDLHIVQSQGVQILERDLVDPPSDYWDAFHDEQLRECNENGKCVQRIYTE